MCKKSVIILLIVILGSMYHPCSAQDVKLEKIEWTDIWVMDANEMANARVLLVGDSIVKGYYGPVEKHLSEKASCARYATSLFLSNPDYLAELGLLLKRYDFDVIHINNGLHGWDYTEEAYRLGLTALLEMMKRDAPEAKLIWCMTTPVRNSKELSQFDAAQNNRVIERNRIAAEIMEAAGIPVNDLYETVKDHPEYFAGDGVHYNGDGQTAQAKQVAERIEKALADR
ncbi:MAG: SGNH/GDSL hydrolase family protein [Candidatus Hydrogenedentes bacterium]|nr:SGNH/GDSL hydrolase family protein [Candidatus Hydrogenedentota bacterium]